MLSDNGKTCNLAQEAFQLHLYFKYSYVCPGCLFRNDVFLEIPPRKRILWAESDVRHKQISPIFVDCSSSEKQYKSVVTGLCSRSEACSKILYFLGSSHNNYITCELNSPVKTEKEVVPFVWEVGHRYKNWFVKIFTL